jgi:hypothetical protein
MAGPVWGQNEPAKGKAAGVSEPAAPPVQPPAGTEPATEEALSLRYRFIERYGAIEDPAHPELITQYRVGISETQKTEREKAQGAPDRSEMFRQTIYTERITQVGKLGEMLSAMRRYDRFAMKEGAVSRVSKPPLYEGLTIWLRRQPGQRPKVLSLTPDRPLRDVEYVELSKQVIVPQLTVLLPPTPKRVGDSWAISRAAAQCLVWEVPDPEDFEMNARLSEVHKSPTGKGLVAVIDISGQMNLTLGLSSLRAQLYFAFDHAAIDTPPPAAAAGETKAATAEPRARTPVDTGVVDARGKISRVRMLWAVSDVIPDGDGRLKQTVTYDLTLERKFEPGPNEKNPGVWAALAVPDPLPTPTESNSWLVFDDPEGRFHFSHPQTLLLANRSVEENMVEFADQIPGLAHDLLILRLPPGPEDPKADKSFRDPQQFQREADTDWAKQKAETLRGPSQWLPDADWAPLKVYRKELGVKTAGADEGASPVQRIFIDYYLVFMKRNECFQVRSMTARNDHVAFRKQVEFMIKSFQFGPWTGSKPGSAPGSTPTAPPVTGAPAAAAPPLSPPATNTPR